MGPYSETTGSAAAPVLVLSEEPALVPTTIRGLAAPPDGVTATKFSECNLGSPLREICSTGSARGDGHKRYTSRPVPTHHNLDKSWLVKFIEQRVADPRILRLIQKWLKAGVMEEGKWSEPQTGSPQGSVISPLLANLYLHYCFDLWVNVWRKKRAQGEVVVLRYADDTVLGFQYQTEADRFLRDLRDRLKKFGLELHPDKTRRIEFGRFAEENRKRRGEGKPETFDFLGFTHISGKNRLGRFAVRRLTIRKRMRSKLRAIKQQLRPRMHDPVRQTGAWLRSVVQGYFNYYAVPGNIGSLSLFRDRLLGIWWHTLCRRSQQRLPWKRMLQLGDRWLPRPRVLHPYPAVRFAATHPR